MKRHTLAAGMHMPPGTWRHNPHSVIIRQHTKNKKLTHTRPTAIRFNNHPFRRNAQACIPPKTSPPGLSLSFVCSFAFTFVRPLFLSFFFLLSSPRLHSVVGCYAPVVSSPRESAPVPRPPLLLCSLLLLAAADGSAWRYRWDTRDGARHAAEATHTRSQEPP